MVTGFVRALTRRRGHGRHPRPASERPFSVERVGSPTSATSSAAETTPDGIRRWPRVVPDSDAHRCWARLWQLSDGGDEGRVPSPRAAGSVAVRTPPSTADADRLFDEMGLDVVAVGFQPRGHWAGIPGQPPTAAHSVDADGEHREVPIGVEVKT